MIYSKKIVTDERLSSAFKMFDKDNSGKLSVQEIINGNQDSEVCFNELKL